MESKASIGTVDVGTAQPTHGNRHNRRSMAHKRSSMAAILVSSGGNDYHYDYDYGYGYDCDCDSECDADIVNDDVYS